MFQTHKNGFALPSAIFILVVLSALSAAIMTVNRYTQKSTIADVLETKSYLAAKAGVEYGSFQALRNTVCNPTPQTVIMTDTFFSGFKFSYDCNETLSNEAGKNQSYYKITSWGCNSSNASCPDGVGQPTNENYVEKSLTVIVAK
ncbi:hypothetical protein GW796_06735 [archaeon]|nr:hypothetical protein [archaeon]